MIDARGVADGFTFLLSVRILLGIRHPRLSHHFTPDWCSCIVGMLISRSSRKSPVLCQDVGTAVIPSPRYQLLDRQIRQSQTLSETHATGIHWPGGSRGTMKSR